MLLSPVYPGDEQILKTWHEILTHKTKPGGRWSLQLHIPAGEKLERNWKA